MKRFDIKSKGRAFLAYLILIPLLGGCSGNFEKYNTHPYRPYDPSLTWLTNLMRIMHYSHENKSQHYDQMIGGEYGGYFSMSNNWDGTNFSTYNPANAWIDKPFEDVLVDTYGEYFEGKRQTEGEGPVFELANIMRVIIMLKLTDTYGPIPYAQMGGGGFVTPYDRQQDLYPRFIDDLTKAIGVLTAYIAATNNEKPLEDYDIVYKGDFTQWVKLANSVKLRIAVRISGVAPSVAQTAAEEAVSHTIGVMTSNTDNAFITTGIQNPYWKAAHSWGDMRSNASIISYMTGYADPRCTEYFTTAKTGDEPFVGMRSGMASFDRAKYLELSAPKFEETDDRMVVMTASEVAFLKAEGALKSWAMGDNVQTLYETGVRLSMEQYGIKPAAIDTYLADDASVPDAYTDPINSAHNANALSAVTIKWDDAAGDEEKLERLIIQKWIALYPLGFEAWCDYRRTGYPRLFKVVDNKGSGMNLTNTERMARRVRFSPSEYLSNRANVEAAVQMLGGPDTPSTDLWWAKKN